MKLYSKDDSYTLYNDNMMNLSEDIAPCSIDSIVTDPPYELGFMGKSWDRSGIAFQADTWKKCYEVLKPGGYMLVFGSSRTFHRIACAIEDAGFEIRDTIMWLYSQGFPKSTNIGLALDKKLGVESDVVGVSTNGSGASYVKLVNHEKGDTGVGYLDGSGKVFDLKEPVSDIGKQFKGWGTQLKPAYEPILIARKPCEGGCVDNVYKYGVGGINIDECRIPFEDTPNPATNPLYRKENGYKINYGVDSDPSSYALKHEPGEMQIDSRGRFPSNVILSYDDETYDEVCGGMPDSEGCKLHRIYSSVDSYDGWGTITKKSGELVGYDDNGGSASRYFYCAKASRRDRNEGLPEHLKNIHPTVKPISLMQYLIRLVTPKGGTILDPFNGSGSTGKAVMYENRDDLKDYKYIGIELTEDYCAISKARIEYAKSDLSKLQVSSTTKKQNGMKVKKFF